MAKTLILAEKPSVGRDIARVFNCTKSINGGLEGNKYIVTWALGHLVTLANPEKYDKQYQKWDINDLQLSLIKCSLLLLKTQLNNIMQLKI